MEIHEVKAVDLCPGNYRGSSTLRLHTEVRVLDSAPFVSPGHSVAVTAPTVPQHPWVQRTTGGSRKGCQGTPTPCRSNWGLFRGVRPLPGFLGRVGRPTSSRDGVPVEGRDCEWTRDGRVGCWSGRATDGGFTRLLSASDVTAPSPSPSPTHSR